MFNKTLSICGWHEKDSCGGLFVEKASFWPTATKSFDNKSALLHRSAMTKPFPNLRDPSLSDEEVRSALDLRPHPEGGHYRELWRDQPPAGGRGAASSILFLLASGQRSHWHRVDAAEIWIWQAGAPLLLEIYDTGGSRKSLSLGPAAGEGETLQGIVPAYAWQAAWSLGAWTLVSCIVAPAFQFEGFELAPPGWSP